MKTDLLNAGAAGTWRPTCMVTCPTATTIAWGVGKEDGIIPGRWTHPLTNLTVIAQAHFRQAVANFGLFGVVCGCLAVVGVILSTLSAHPKPHTITDLPATCFGVRLRAARRRTTDEGSDVSTVAASYVRFSSDLQDEASNEQQRRKCREAAAARGHVIQPELEFGDEAVSGTKKERDGLNAMMEAARQRKFGILYLDSLSRLARESILTMPMLKELVYVCNVRVISVSEGMDSSQNNWEIMANFMARVHEQYIKTLRAAVLRGQEYAVQAGFSVGDWSFGYGSEPIPGTAVGRGRNAKPRMRYVINEEHAKWVRLIFVWFVEERRSIAWIARELTQRNAPKDHRSTTQDWHPEYVRRVLANRKYIGLWPWGKQTNVRNPLTGQVHQEERPAEETAKWERELPELRLVDDAIFFKAQALLAEQEAKVNRSRTGRGRLTGSTVDSARPRHLLQGLCKCRACDGGAFQVNGANGKYLGCVNYKKGSCDCRTRLLRALAEKILLQAIGERILRNPAWHQAVFDEAAIAWQQLQQGRPDELKEVERALAENQQRIDRLVDSIEKGEAAPEVHARLAERRAERQKLHRRRDEVRQQQTAPQQPPTPEWIDEKIRGLHQLLNNGTPAAALALRDLVGGSIKLTEACRPGYKRKFLRGTFTLTSLATANCIGVEQASSSSAARTEEVVLDFVEPPPWAAIADHVKELFDAGLPGKQIAAAIPCDFSWVAKALAWWHRQRNLPVPDGRALRCRLGRPSEPNQQTI